MYPNFTHEGIHAQKGCGTRFEDVGELFFVILLLLLVQLHVNDLHCSTRNNYYRYRLGSKLSTPLHRQ